MAWHCKKLQLDNFETMIFDNSLTNAMSDLGRNSCRFFQAKVTIGFCAAAQAMRMEEYVSETS